jgi:hypothetical protein
MPIYRLLQDAAFDPEHVELMYSAFEDVCRDLGSVNDDASRNAIAHAIIECAKQGVRDHASLRKRGHEALASGLP